MELVQSWAAKPLKLTGNKISGLGLVWWDGTDATRTAIGKNQYIALSKNATIEHHRDDVICSYNHNMSPLARQSNNTLQITRTNEGYHYSAELNANDPEHMSVLAKINRNDVVGSSAYFFVNKTEWQEIPDGELCLCTSIELWEIGPVSVPAMTKSTAMAASLGYDEYAERLAETRKRFKK